MLSVKGRAVRGRCVHMVGNWLAIRKNGSRTPRKFCLQMCNLPALLLNNDPRRLSSGYIHIFQTAFCTYHFIIKLTLWNRHTVTIIPILKTKTPRHKWHELGTCILFMEYIYPGDYLLLANSSSSSFFLFGGDRDLVFSTGGLGTPLTFPNFFQSFHLPQAWSLWGCCVPGCAFVCDWWLGKKGEAWPFYLIVHRWYKYGNNLCKQLSKRGIRAWLLNNGTWWPSD